MQIGRTIRRVQRIAGTGPRSVGPVPAMRIPPLHLSYHSMDVRAFVCVRVCVCACVCVCRSSLACSDVRPVATTRTFDGAASLSSIPAAFPVPIPVAVPAEPAASAGSCATATAGGGGEAAAAVVVSSSRSC